jgi:hypothetical protein
MSLLVPGCVLLLDLWATSDDYLEIHEDAALSVLKDAVRPLGVPDASLHPRRGRA